MAAKYNAKLIDNENAKKYANILSNNTYEKKKYNELGLFLMTYDALTPKANAFLPESCFISNNADCEIVKNNPWAMNYFYCFVLPKMGLINYVRFTMIAETSDPPYWFKCTPTYEECSKNYRECQPEK
uniref:Uncharacterized protein n=1 Tax=Panagrolaimus sp. JU765 TaxID=591449 RepID=A0AC34Q986_9BILA